MLTEKGRKSEQILRACTFLQAMYCCYKKMMNKIDLLTKKISEKILRGDYGKSGEQFLSVREICKQENISFNLSYALFQNLEKEHLIFLIKQKWYLTYGIANENSALRSNSSDKIIGIHVKEINNTYITSILALLSQQLKLSNYKMIIETSENDSENELKILDHFIRLGCCGVINFSSTKNNFIDYFRFYPLPMVFIGRLIKLSESEHMPCVLTDNYLTAKHVANEFLNRGYKQFYFVGIKSLPEKNDERLNGYIDELKANNQSVIEENIFKTEYSDDTALSNFCYKISKKASIDSPIAIFCINDLFASKILKNLLSFNVDIPNRVGIIGYDDLPICKDSTPQLTSISYSFKEIAKQSIDLLFSITNETPLLNHKKTVMNFIIARGSIVNK